MNEENIGIRCIVTGRVQGVFFRASTRKQALSLGLQGYAKNLSDGTVEVVLKGTSNAVAQLKEWLHEGPSAANVRSVVCEPLNQKQVKQLPLNQFIIL